MLLEVTHQTDLAYSDLISETQMELHMCPRQEQDQHRLSFDLAIGPEAGVTSYFDWLGNTVHAFTVNAFHKQIRIIATSVLETDRAVHDAQEIPDVWPFRSADGQYFIYDYLHFDGPVVDSPALRDLVAAAEPIEGMRSGELITRMMRLIDQRFTYETGVTNAASPITAVLEHKRGVCQDFTHLLIGMARAVGIPARYVSGFLHADDDGRYRGFSQSHAWCELLFPSIGWTGFDPTNQCAVGNNFVKLAVGRHYRDVAPNRGKFRGNSKENMTVTVKSRELGAIPQQLAAERMQSLQIPTYPGWGTVGLEQIRQLEEQQQQQREQQQQQQQQ